jgi:hypothetical protein
VTLAARTRAAGADAPPAPDAYSYTYAVHADRLIAEQEGSVTVSGPQRRIETKTDGAAVVKTWPDGTRCFSFDVQSRTFWECSEAASIPPAGRPDVSRLAVRPVAIPEEPGDARAGLKRRGALLSCRLTSALPGGAQNTASRFLRAYVEDLTVELVVREAEAPGLVVPWRLHANLLGQRLPPVEDALVAFLSSGEGRPERLHVRTTRTAEGGAAVSDDVDAVFGEFRRSAASPDLFQVPPGYRHEKPVLGIPIR